VRTATGSLLVAIGWAVVVATSVVVAARVRLHRSRAGASGGPVVALRMSDLVVGGVVGIITYAAIFVAIHLTIRFTVFGGLAITYLDLVVGVPLVMVAVLAAAAATRRAVRSRGSARMGTRPALVVCGAGLLLAPIGFYATHIEPGMLEVDRPEPLAVAAVRAGDQRLVVGVLTDLQTTVVGDHEREAVTELMAARPDVILLPGDFLQVDDDEFERELPALRELLGRLQAPGGVYLVGGDVDHPLERLDQMVEASHIRYLADEVVTTSVGDRELTIGGIGVDYQAPAAQAVIDRLESDPGDDDIRILLSHRPDPVLGLRPGSRIDLQVSGHTHGGQVSVPFIGPLMTLSGVPRTVAAGGLHELDGHPIYVGHGVGLERGFAPQIRFGVRPDVGVLTVTG
jgi:predicted MPP superfamily phosphohydrolase